MHDDGFATTLRNDYNGWSYNLGLREDDWSAVLNISITDTLGFGCEHARAVFDDNRSTWARYLWWRVRSSMLHWARFASIMQCILSEVEPGPGIRPHNVRSARSNAWRSCIHKTLSRLSKSPALSNAHYSSARPSTDSSANTGLPSSHH